MEDFDIWLLVCPNFWQECWVYLWAVQKEACMLLHIDKLEVIELWEGQNTLYLVHSTYWRVPISWNNEKLMLHQLSAISGPNSIFLNRLVHWSKISVPTYVLHQKNLAMLTTQLFCVVIQHCVAIFLRQVWRPWNEMADHHITDGFELEIMIHAGSRCCCFYTWGNGRMDYLPLLSSRRTLYYWWCALCCRFW